MTGGEYGQALDALVRLKPAYRCVLHGSHGQCGGLGHPEQPVIVAPRSGRFF